MNYLSRIIHIWYWDRAWAEKIFEDIIDVLQPEYILAVRKGKSEMSVYFLDGSVLRMIPEEESMRARRSTETFIQYGTKLEFSERVIFPTCRIHRPRVIASALDIMNGGTLASVYYDETLNIANEWE